MSSNDASTMVASQPRKPRKPAPTRDSVLTSVDTILTTIDTEIDRLRSSNLRGIMFLKSVRKKIRVLEKDAGRVMVDKPRKPVVKNTGINKPVPISTEFAVFAGLNPELPHPRPTCNAIVHQYIADNDLQNPDDRRIILPDETLSELLDYDPDMGVLNYSTLQTYLKHHYNVKRVRK